MSGEIISICGKSGIGKTTILRIIAGLLKPSSGTALIEGLESEIPKDIWICYSGLFPIFTALVKS
jgi:ABC-type multidrug transport system ATPase subunit